MPEVSGKVSVYLNVAMAVVGGIATASPSVFPSYIPSGVVADIIQTAGFVSLIGGIVNAALHAAGGTGVAK